MLRAISEVADIETRLGPGGLYFDRVFQHSRRHCVGLVRDLVEADSVGFFDNALSLSKKADAQGFIVNARASNRHCSIPSFGPLLTGEGLCQVEFQEAPEDAQNWFVGSSDIEDTFHQMRIPGWLLAFFALPTVLASEVGYTEKRSIEDVLHPIFCYFLSPRHCQWVLLERCFSATMSQVMVPSQDMRIPLFSSVVATRHDRGSGANMACDPLASVARMLTVLGDLARGSDCTIGQLTRLNAGVQKAVSMFTTYLFPEEVLIFLGTKCLQQIIVRWNWQTDITDALRQWSSSSITITSEAQQSWCNLNP